jgi:hypothetical protein
MMFTPGSLLAPKFTITMNAVDNNGTSVFPLPTLLLLIKKRASPDPHGLAKSVIYGTSTDSCVFPPWLRQSFLNNFYGFVEFCTENVTLFSYRYAVRLFLLHFLSLLLKICF